MCVSIATAMLISTVASVGMGIAQMAMAPDPPSFDSTETGPVSDAPVEQAAKDSRADLATNIKSRKAAVQAGVATPTSLTGPGGVPDEELNLGSNRLI